LFTSKIVQPINLLNNSNLMIKAIIFDMDGVLVDSDPLHVSIEKRQIEANNILISDEEHLQFIGVASDVMWYEIAKRYALPIELRKNYKKKKKDRNAFL